jgi:hypothetical protein
MTMILIALAIALGLFVLGVGMAFFLYWLLPSIDYNREA